ncbi:PilZ domain-containing protein [Sphingobium sp.]|uniref:PilZ domain-containing protein n=1 Tax=Sphingobium sp. TaxID=1912891 RepID=UPI00262302DE|nr:PilZ domain-containing protein [Sphingobium sp.]
MDEERDISDRGPARAAPRDSLFLLTDLQTVDGTMLGKARIRNLSATGLMADCERSVSVGTKIECELRGVGKVTGVVAWARDDKIGMAFDEPIDPQLARKPVVGLQQSMPDYLRVHQRQTPRR